MDDINALSKEDVQEPILPNYESANVDYIVIQGRCTGFKAKAAKKIVETDKDMYDAAE